LSEERKPDKTTNNIMNAKG